MFYTISKLVVEDYEKFKSDWDASLELRKMGGQKSFAIYQTTDDPNTFMLLMGWNAEDVAKMFMESPLLQDFLKGAGVTDHETWFVNESEKGEL
jgi:hypothetical protein